MFILGGKHHAIVCNFLYQPLISWPLNKALGNPFIPTHTHTNTLTQEFLVFMNISWLWALPGRQGSVHVISDIDGHHTVAISHLFWNRNEEGKVTCARAMQRCMKISLVGPKRVGFLSALWSLLVPWGAFEKDHHPMPKQPPSPKAILYHKVYRKSRGRCSPFHQ